MQQTDRLAGIKCFVLDMDGTIYLGNRLFPETKPFLEAVEKSGREYCFFTNNSSKNLKSYINKLAGMGICVPEEKMLISNGVMVEWLLKHHPGERAFVVGTPDLCEAIQAGGIPLSQTNPDFVLLGFDTTLTYEKIRKACDFIREGKPVYGLNPDWNCPTEDGFMPDCGSIAALVRASTGVQCEFFGKPSPHTLDYLLRKTGCRPEELAVVGDRLYTDIAVAQNSPVLSILVLSGESNLEDVEASPIKPDLIFPHIGEIIPHLTNTCEKFS